MVTQNPTAGNSGPGMVISRPGEIAQAARTVTTRRMVPIGLAGIGIAPYQEILTATLGEDGGLLNETQVLVATCAGSGDLIKSEADAGAMCMFDKLILCVYCAPKFRCSCGRQTCARCAMKSGVSALLCRICEQGNGEGGSGWFSILPWALGPGSQLTAIPTWAATPSSSRSGL